MVQSWQFWALLSAGFAALTAILAKIGVSGINPDFATLIRTGFVVIVLVIIVSMTGQFQSLSEIPKKTWVFLALSGVGTGALLLSCFRALKLGDASRVAPVDKLPIVLVAIFGVIFLGETLKAIHWVAVAMIASGAIMLAVF